MTSATIIAKLAAVLRQPDASITNIESALARAGVSAQDISDRFGGNRKLLVAMVSQLSEAMSAPLEAGAAGNDWRQRLVDFGERVADHYTTSHLRGLYRIAITESSRHTGLGRDFYDAGPGRLMQRLTEFMRAAQAEGALRGADAGLQASHFLSLLRVNLDIADTFPRDRAASSATHAAYVRSVVDVFCRGINGGTRSC